MLKKSLIIILTVLIFASTCILGVSTVYRVTAVTLDASVVSAAAQEEAKDLQARLESAYYKKSIFSVDETEAQSVFADFPYFRIASFQKEYPNRIVITVSEDAEVFAVSTEENMYYILGIDGTVLEYRETSSNRLDNAENILVKGITAQGVKGEILQGGNYFSALLTFCQKANEMLDGIRRNVVSIEVMQKTSLAEETILLITLREGIKMYIGNPLSQSREKAETAFGKYLSLSAEERLTGRIAVFDRNGELTVDVSKEDFNS